MPTGNRGRFRKGHDPRRHRFTREQCCLGYERALASIDRRYPGCDAHFILCAMIGSKPLTFLLREMLRTQSGEEASACGSSATARRASGQSTTQPAP